MRQCPEKVGIKHWIAVPFIDRLTTGMLMILPLSDAMNGSAHGTSEG